MNSCFLKALDLKHTDRTPIWLMRQAGRYLPEYRKIRAKFTNFLDMCKNSDICAELALQPIKRFDLDASILFSDILTIPDAFDLELEFKDGEGPFFNNPINVVDKIRNLPDFDLEKVDYVFEAVRKTRFNLPSDIPLIGFCGSPWTLVAYSVEGGSSVQFERTKKFIKNHPKEIHDLLKRYTLACFDYLKEQAKAGINAFQIFDSWANLLSEDDFIDFSLKYSKALIDMLKADEVTKKIPIILFARDPRAQLKIFKIKGIACLSLYWNMDVQYARKIFEGKVAIQGNLNPATLTKKDEDIELELNNLLNQIHNYNGYIFNLGHGITPNIDPNKVSLLIQLIRNFNPTT